MTALETTREARGGAPRRRARHGATASLMAWIAVLAALSVASSPALAQASAPNPTEDPLSVFLAPLASNPAVLAAQHRVDAARLTLQAAFDPVSLQASGAYSLLDNDDIDVDPITPGEQGLPGSATNLSAALTLRPFVFGDTADQADQRRVQLQQAELEAAAGLVQVQTQALDAALGVNLARESLDIAEQGAALADASLAATRLRFQNGAANARDVRNAESGAAEAHKFVTDAESGLALAERSLEALVGDVEPPPQDLLDLPVPTGVAASVRRAQLNAALVEIGIRSARRSVYPVAQASYTWNIDDHNKLGVALESRTLQPTLNYAYADPGASYPQNATNGTFTIGVSAVISPGVFLGLAATEANLRAAQGNVEAARQAAELQLASLDAGLARAQRDLELATRKLADATATLEEAERRESLGLDPPLLTQNAALDRTRAALDVQQTRQDVLDAICAYYAFYAIPLSATPDPVDTTAAATPASEANP